MANFKEAYLKTSVTEGKWCNVEGDTGGETWKGIARNSHPSFAGWVSIDFHKKEIKFPAKPLKADIDKLNAKLSADVTLEKQVQEFYKARFWDKVRGDELKMQTVADSIYDSAVNMGPNRAIKLSQKALKVEETGVIDDTMLKKLNNEA